jgi:hypothetical protein
MRTEGIGRKFFRSLLEVQTLQVYNDKFDTNLGKEYVRLGYGKYQ